MPYHHKKPFDPSGDVYATSVTRTMKSQALSAWDMFTRETLQNSWDARDRASTDDGVTFAIDFRELFADQVSTLRQEVFGNDFVGIPELEKALGQNSITALCVSDSGTHGLRGPSKATAAVDGPTDFNSFIRNIGRSDSKVLAGGTYGFGKGVFFIASEVNTVVVYTRTVDENNRRVHRLIAMSNSEDFNADGVAYTGRHWWGEHAIEETGIDRTEYAEPFEGETADRIASLLGLDAHFTEERPTGTSIMILSPDMSASTETEESDIVPLEQRQRGILQEIANSLTRWAWPHMIDVDTGMDPIEFLVSFKGEPVKIINPDEDKALRRFIDAFVQAIEHQDAPMNAWEHFFNGRVTRLASIRPKKVLGTLSLIDLPKPIKIVDTIIDKDVSSHIATIRNPRMIVEYYKAPEATTGKPYCGVFIADEDADIVFARSEPAGHHQWNYETITQDHELLRGFWNSTNNPVSIFFRRLKEMVRSTGTAGNSHAKSQHLKAATALSQSLGSLISNAIGGTGNSSVDTKKKKPRPNSSVSKPRPTYDSRVQSLRKTAGGTITTFQLDVAIPPSQLPVELSVTPIVDSDQGNILENLRQVGIAVPSVMGIRDSSSEASLDTLSGSVEESLKTALFEEHQELLVDVFQPKDTAVRLEVNFERNVQTANSLYKKDNANG
ncbi:hypothetical protein [Corynebacterium flavescens]|uniref:ATP-binding protein n=2 Tax=Corynebacterium flavescens TaxID=28028 RepID=A0AB73B4T7_CORFL|nr:hypothetical protein [Corynebacterium flavescens]KAA8722756.1 hypothetical protein F4V60_04840 [Corynebacterium flavescens]GEB96648.1 hypothetical protein CFL01nite_01430 [Corynebacterium flavescens]